MYSHKWRDIKVLRLIQNLLLTFVQVEAKHLLLKTCIWLVINSLHATQGEVNAIKWDPTGSLLASCSDDGTAKVNIPHSSCMCLLYGIICMLFLPYFSYKRKAILILWIIILFHRV